ncbi:hypothetical protein [Flavobacterium sp. PL002]|uniref:hypothetical protein n=2 Tax=unclassified Flavobacterium TaxID=196869 RepID=UPI001787D8A3|nr:hypothetical protein [Flavobacterium sp. PL002]MBE0390435.1 hypothetical protein [Flavobacterium sp. PL002]
MESNSTQPNKFYLPNINNITFNIVMLFLILASALSYGQSNVCNATLKVENDGNIRSTPPSGTYYSLFIKNNGVAVDTYTLASKDINATCQNPDGSTTAENVLINLDFIDVNKNPINTISVNPGESINFYAHVTLNPATKKEKWACTSLFVQSGNCTNYKTETILHTYIIDPSKD